MTADGKEPLGPIEIWAHQVFFRFIHTVLSPERSRIEFDGFNFYSQ